MPVTSPVELSTIIKYRHHGVEERMRDNFNLGTSEIQTLHCDLNRWLWLCGTSPKNLPFKLEIVPSMAILDEFWHAFILFTEDYFKFCFSNFGEYIHHRPNVSTNTKSIQTQDQLTNRKIERLGYYRYVTKTLGPDVALRWFRDYKKISPDTIRKSAHGDHR
jgi:hypothetical protein